MSVRSCRLAIGVLIPAVNIVMEGEFHRMAPEGVDVFTARVTSKHYDPADSFYKASKKLVDAIPEGSLRIKRTNPDIVVFGCTTSSFLEGQQWNKDIVRTMERVTQKPALTSTDAVVMALKAMQLKRIAVATPYTDDVNQRLAEYLSLEGMEIARLTAIPYEEAQSESSAHRVAQGIDGPDVDGIFISCTDFKTIHVLGLLEKELSKPIISSNQATFWACLRKGGIPDQLQGLGSLLLKP